MSKKNIIKISLDVVMTTILVLLYNSHVFALAFHEIAGLSLAGMFVLHCLLNKKWIAAITTKFFSKSLATRVRIGYIIDFLLLVTFIFVMISGIKSSQVLFPELAAPKGSAWRGIHHFSGAIAIILVGVHIGLHWGFITGMFMKLLHIPVIIAKPLGIGLLVAILAFGTYSIATSSFRWWLVEPFGITESHAHAPEQSQLQDESVVPDTTATNDPARNTDEAKNETSDYNDQKSKDGENKNGAINQTPSSIEDAEGNSANEGDYGTHPEGEKKMEEGDPSVIAHTVATYLSIIGVFVAITYYLDNS